MPDCAAWTRALRLGPLHRHRGTSPGSAASTGGGGGFFAARRRRGLRRCLPACLRCWGLRDPGVIRTSITVIHTVRWPGEGKATRSTSPGAIRQCTLLAAAREQGFEMINGERIVGELLQENRRSLGAAVKYAAMFDGLFGRNRRLYRGWRIEWVQMKSEMGSTVLDCDHRTSISQMSAEDLRLVTHLRPPLQWSKRRAALYSSTDGVIGSCGVSAAGPGRDSLCLHSRRHRTFRPELHD